MLGRKTRFLSFLAVFTSLSLHFALITESRAATQRPLTVFAAASLKNSLDTIVKSFLASHEGARVTVSYAGTNALAKQIEQGAPVDIFISADPLWMTYLRQLNLLQDGTLNLVANRLVLIAPRDRAGITQSGTGADALANLAILLKSGRLAVANTHSVPAGRYAKSALVRLGQWAKVKDRLAEANNVRVALSYVARGEAPLGIVYFTDAKAEPGVKIIADLPADSKDAIVYQAAAIAGSKHPATATFMAYLQSSRARTDFEAQGFVFMGREVHSGAENGASVTRGAGAERSLR